MQESPLTRVRRHTARRYPTLLVPHPLDAVDCSNEDRLQYLAVLAFCLAVGREPNSVESDAFIGLAERMGIHEYEALEQLHQRANLDYPTLERLLQALQAKQLHWAWLIDAVWQQNRSGKPQADDAALVTELAFCWGVEQSWLDALRQWADLLHAREYGRAKQLADSVLKTGRPAALIYWLESGEISLTSQPSARKTSILIEIKNILSILQILNLPLTFSWE